MSAPVTCKYFLRGTCRYGDRCRFYHPPGGQPQGYFGSGQPDYRNQIQESQQKLKENLKAIEDIVKRDMVEWEKGKMWPFSCYGPTGGKPNLEGFEDLSPEELRYATLMNRGAVPNEVAMRIQLWNRARAKWQQTTQANLSTLEQLLTGNTLSQQSQMPFGQTQQTTTGGFGSSAPGFQTGPAFGQQTAPAPSIFGGSKPSAALNNFSFAMDNKPQGMQSSIPGSMGGQMGSNPLSSFSFNTALQQQTTNNQHFNQNFQTNQPQPFQSNQMQAFQPNQSQSFAQNFAPPAQPQLQPQQPTQQSGLSSFSFAPNMVVQPSGPSSFAAGFPAPATSSFPFGGQQTNIAQAPSNILGFGGGGPAFGVTPVANDVYDKNLYSEMTDLSADEIKAFEAPQFDASNIPLHAPAKKFCF